MTPLRRYYRGHSLVAMRDVQAAQTRYYHADNQGTVQALTDSTGAVTDRFASDAWGVQVKRTGSSINRQWYVGQLGYVRQVDQALDYVRARYLAIPRGRWLARDPLGARGRAGPYGYCANTPAAKVDPSGRQGHAPLYSVEVDHIRNRERPFVLDQCGGIIFQIAWKVLGPNQAHLDGWLIQYVEVSGEVKNCDQPPELVGAGDLNVPLGFKYYEAWEVRDGIIAQRGVDTFGIDVAAKVTPTQGWLRVTGHAVFLLDAEYSVVYEPLGDWMTPEKCNSLHPPWKINLPCTMKDVKKFDHAHSTEHHVEMHWVCGCGGGCRCTQCDWAPKRRQDRECDPRGACAG
jgi:RHS repeat-associated protein